MALVALCDTLNQDRTGLSLWSSDRRLQFVQLHPCALPPPRTPQQRRQQASFKSPSHSTWIYHFEKSRSGRTLKLRETWTALRITRDGKSSGELGVSWREQESGCKVTKSVPSRVIALSWVCILLETEWPLLCWHYGKGRVGTRMRGPVGDGVYRVGEPHLSWSFMYPTTVLTAKGEIQH